jgi:hypothetical protein
MLQRAPLFPDLLMPTEPDLSSAAFKALLHSTFRVTIAGADQPVELVLARERDGRPSAEVEQFAIEFVGPLEPFLPQGVYPLNHDHMGTFDLFIVPVGREDGGFTYEAVFNRLLDRRPQPPAS